MPLGQAQVVGHALQDGRSATSAHPNHVFEIAQHYDYMNNEDYEFGGQSFGPVRSSPASTSAADGASSTRLDGSGDAPGS